MVDQTGVIEALKTVNDPELEKSLVELGMVNDVAVDGEMVSFTLALTTLACPLRESIVDDARQAVLALEGVEDVQVSLREMTQEEKRRIWPQQPRRREPGVAEHLNHIERVLAVMSGKGGVGKSSVAAMLAGAPRQQGKRCGVLSPASPTTWTPVGPTPIPTPPTPIPVIPSGAVGPSSSTEGRSPPMRSRVTSTGLSAGSGATSGTTVSTGPGSSAASPTNS